MQAETPDDGRAPYMTATAVTTRTATMHEDLEKNQKTSQVCKSLIYIIIFYMTKHKLLFSTNQKISVYWTLQ